MGSYTYDVWDDHGNIIAKDMTLENAIIFLKGLFNEYYNESDIAYTLKRREVK